MHSLAPAVPRHAAADPRDVVDSHVEVLQLLQPMQVLNLPDQVVLQVQDAQVPADVAEQLNALDALLVERHLLQRSNHALVVFRPLRGRGDARMREGAPGKLAGRLARLEQRASGARPGEGELQLQEQTPRPQRTRRSMSTVIRPIGPYLALGLPPASPRFCPPASLPAVTVNPTG